MTMGTRSDEIGCDIDSESHLPANGWKHLLDWELASLSFGVELDLAVRSNGLVTVFSIAAKQSTATKGEGDVHRDWQRTPRGADALRVPRPRDLRVGVVWASVDLASNFLLLWHLLALRPPSASDLYAVLDDEHAI